MCSNANDLSDYESEGREFESLPAHQGHLRLQVTFQFVKEYSPKSLRNREGFWYNRRKPPREAPSWKSTPKTPAAKQWLLT